MASLAKTYDVQKLRGQVYTPRFVVEKMLSDLCPNPSDFLGKSILDPACGDGQFLAAIAEKIAEVSPKERLKENLERLYGWDIDPNAVSLCVSNLNRFAKNLGLEINWNVQVCDSLKKILDQSSQKFDLIVGNPPYIRIQHLEETERKFIQSRYGFCKSGSTDAYIAFYELCDFLLNPNGKCALITPNTFFYSETARAMRRYFERAQTIVQITNYGDIQLFENATTYSAIMIFGKKRREHFLFEQAKTVTDFERREISFAEIKGQKFWKLCAHNPFSSDDKKGSGIRLKDICEIHVGITTLCDKAYIFPIKFLPDEPNYALAQTRLKGDVKLEKAILKPIIKASKLKSGDDEIREYILFPYEKRNGKHKIIPEHRLQAEFPLAYQYLLSVRSELDKRDNGKPNPVAWYAFGRSQGLDTSFGKKILFSPMNRKPNFILVANEDATFYSGYCIKFHGDYEWLLRQLNSERFANFISVSSRDFRGGWKAYNKKSLEDFFIPITEINSQSPLMLDFGNP